MVSKAGVDYGQYWASAGYKDHELRFLAAKQIISDLTLCGAGNIAVFSDTILFDMPPREFASVTKEELEDHFRQFGLTMDRFGPGYNTGNIQQRYKLVRTAGNPFRGGYLNSEETLDHYKDTRLGKPINPLPYVGELKEKSKEPVVLSEEETANIANFGAF